MTTAIYGYNFYTIAGDTSWLQAQIQFEESISELTRIASLASESLPSYFLDSSPGVNESSFLQFNNSNYISPSSYSGNSYWTYGYGVDFYYGNSDINSIEFNYNADEVTISVNNAGMYEIVTPDGIARVVNFEYAIFNDSAIELEESIAENWSFDTYLGNSYPVTFYGEEDDAYVYLGGNDIFTGYEGYDTLIVDFNLDEVELVKDLSGVLTFVKTPNGIATIANVEQIYFSDQVVLLEETPQVSYTPARDEAYSVDAGWDYFTYNIPGKSNYVSQRLSGEADATNMLLLQEYSYKDAWTELLPTGHTMLYLEQSPSSPILSMELKDWNYVYFKDLDYDLSYQLERQETRDPITGTFDGPGTVNLNNKGVTPFTLFGSDELNVEAIKVDSLVFGGEGSGIGVAQKKIDSFFASYEDVNEDGELDLVVKVQTSDFAGMAPTEPEPFEVFGFLTDETTQVVFGLNEGDSINFI